MLILPALRRLLKIYENYVRKPKTDKVKSSPNSNADGSMSVDHTCNVEVYLNSVFIRSDVAIRCIYSRV